MSAGGQRHPQVDIRLLQDTLLSFLYTPIFFSTGLEKLKSELLEGHDRRGGCAGQGQRHYAMVLAKDISAADLNGECR